MRKNLNSIYICFPAVGYKRSNFYLFVLSHPTVFRALAGTSPFSSHVHLQSVETRLRVLELYCSRECQPKFRLFANFRPPTFCQNSHLVPPRRHLPRFFPMTIAILGTPPFFFPLRPAPPPIETFAFWPIGYAHPFVPTDPFTPFPEAPFSFLEYGSPQHLNLFLLPLPVRPQFFAIDLSEK